MRNNQILWLCGPRAFRGVSLCFCSFVVWLSVTQLDGSRPSPFTVGLFLIDADTLFPGPRGAKGGPKTTCHRGSRCLTAFIIPSVAYNVVQTHSPKLHFASS